MSYIVPRDKKDEDAHEQETEDGEVTFDQTPVKVVCPHCGLTVITFIEHEASWVTYAVSIVLLLVLNWAALCVVPVVYPLFKDVVHHCPRCLSVLATRSRVAVSSFKQEVMSIRFGNCAIVLARKYVVMMLALMALIGCFHYARSSSAASTGGLDSVVRSEVVALQWEDFMKDCGFKSYLGNPIHVTVAFNERYKNKTFNWQGTVHHFEEGISFLWWNQRGALFAQMDPPQFPMKRGHDPDLVLVYSDTDKVSESVGKLKRGDSFNFVATMVEVGRRGMPHVMVLWEVHLDAERGAHQGAAGTLQATGGGIAAMAAAAAASSAEPPAAPAAPRPVAVGARPNSTADVDHR